MNGNIYKHKDTFLFLQHHNKRQRIPKNVDGGLQLSQTMFFIRQYQMMNCIIKGMYLRSCIQISAALMYYYGNVHWRYCMFRTTIRELFVDINIVECDETHFNETKVPLVLVHCIERVISLIFIRQSLVILSLLSRTDHLSQLQPRMRRLTHLNSYIQSI